MPNYSPNAKSLLNCLSDFWTLYFKDIATIEEIYRGAEIDAGQAYLDLLALMLNSSVQDATLFNKEYFKLLRIREDAVTYDASGRWRVPLGKDITSVRYLHNKIFGVSAGFEEGVDFDYDERTRAALFSYDPTNAYYVALFGEDNGALRVTGRNPNQALTVDLLDDGTLSPTITVSDGLITVAFDGLANTGTVTAAAIVSALNAHPVAGGLVFAEIAGLGTGTASLDGATQDLVPQEVSPAQGYAARAYDVTFGTRFFDVATSAIGGWVARGVRKGDVLRIMKSPRYGASLEFPVALVREDSLYLYPQAAPDSLAGQLDYLVLRSPADDTILSEPVPGQNSLTLAGGVIDGAARTLDVGGPFFPLEVQAIYGTAVWLSGAYNRGEYRITEILSPSKVVLEGPPLVSETGVSWQVMFTANSANNDLTAVDNGDGTATVTSVTMLAPDECVGTVLSIYRGLGVFDRYEVVSKLSATSVVVRTPSPLTGTGLYYALDTERVPEFTPAFGASTARVLPGSLTISARRLFDGETVQEGRDFTVDVDTGAVRPLTVWRGSFLNTCSYRYRTVVAAPSSWGIGVSGAFGGTGPYTYTAPPLAGTPRLAGMALEVLDSALAVNDGRYYIDAPSGGSGVVLSSERSPVLPEINNGALRGRVYSTGGIDLVNTTVKVTEIGVWAVDALVDRYHLYFTYGYLIDKVSVSSETYRAVIRGLFQLFMLGPTLERFEAAINTLAGLPVIRDDKEILLSYSSGATQAGTDGVFVAGTRQFTSASATFTQSDTNRRLYAVSGLNAGSLFTVESVIDANTLVLAETATWDSGVSWELTETATHQVTTSRAVYSLPRSVGVKPKYTTSANWGTLSLRAFEVISSAFTVTDYVEAPRWWESSRIPAVLMPNESAQRRQATPALFENVVGAADNPHAGDPGLYAGADDEGRIPPVFILATGAYGTLYGDPFYPVRNTEVYFEAPTLALTTSDVGNKIRFNYPHAGTEYRILELVSPTRARVESFYGALATEWTDDWELITGTLAMRHKMAYLVLDHFLKYQVFTVSFEAALLNLLDVDLIGDINKYVFQAKPSYTYLMLSPYTVFDDVITPSEDSIEVDAVYQLAGRGGEVTQANENPLMADGSWVAGGWYRYASNTGTVVMPAPSVPDALGTPPAGYRYRLHQVYLDPATFVDAATGRSIPFSAPKAAYPGVDGINDAELFAPDATGAARLVTDDPVFEPWMVLYGIEVWSSSTTNDGIYRIGQVVSPTEVLLYGPAVIAESHTFNWELFADVYVFDGATSVTAEGETLLTTQPGTHDDFSPSAVGSYVRRFLTTENLQRAWRIDHVYDSSTVRLAQRHAFLGPGQTAAALAVTSAGVLVVPSIVFTPDMAYQWRATNTPSVAAKEQYIVRFLSGANGGEERRIEQYVSPISVVLAGSVTADSTFDIEIDLVRCYDIVPETGPFGVYEDVVWVDNMGVTALLGEIDVSSANPAAGNVDYEAAGVLEPVDPAVEVIDLTLGDTYYMCGGLDPAPRRIRPRTGQDMDQQELPLQIAERPPGA